ncbi:MAG: Gfo/Idh/MocA family oxidoreductase [Verrucomicrobiales bacterium]|nr:Gfo/Idh/MocA family oxidoreductase [Verrucomicrobiales bacterium]
MHKTTSRRSFLQLSAAAALTLPWLPPANSQPVGPRRRYRAAIIGDTGHGDYGHGYDQVFNGLEEVQVVAVADPVTEGARKAAQRSGAARTYNDYREMLGREKPELVCIAMRQPARHLELARAAMACARGLFIEKPITETLPQADALCQAAEAAGVKVAVAHHRRYLGSFAQARALLHEGFFGAIREVQIHGKQDARAGGEDLIVLGTHDFDYLRWCFGDPQWCEATVMVKGRDATPADARPGREPMRVVGDTIHAQFGFPGGMAVRWSSVTTDDDWTTRSLRERWAFEMFGSRRLLAWQSGIEFRYRDTPFLLHPESGADWQPLPAAQASDLGNVQQIRDLIRAIETDTAPRCSGKDGAWAIEMLTAVYQSHFRRQRVDFPLADRRDPLA